MRSSGGGDPDECTPDQSPLTGVVRTGSISSLATIVVAMPVMLVGALSVLMREDLVLDEARLGWGVSVYFMVAGVASLVGGRVAERLPSRVSVRLGLGASAIALLTAGFVATRWWHIVVALGIAGLATGVLHPAINLVLARQVRSGIQGLLFGVKQAAVPAAALLAGFSVPIMAIVGWRWAFLVAGAAAVALVAAVPAWTERRPVGRTEQEDRSFPLGPVVVIGLGGALASGAANAMSIFLVLFSTSAGLSVELAATVLVVASLSGITARLSAGALVDRLTGQPFVMVGLMVWGGAVGYLVLSYARSPLLIISGSVIAFTAGWGWPGVMLLGVVRSSPMAPALASGIAQGATFFGAVIGPAAFGFIVSASSYAAAWRVLAAAALLGGCLLLVGNRMFPDPVEAGGSTTPAPERTRRP